MSFFIGQTLTPFVLIRFYEQFFKFSCKQVSNSDHQIRKQGQRPLDHNLQRPVAPLRHPSKSLSLFATSLVSEGIDWGEIAHLTS